MTILFVFTFAELVRHLEREQGRPGPGLGPGPWPFKSLGSHELPISIVGILYLLKRTVYFGSYVGNLYVIRLIIFTIYLSRQGQAGPVCLQYLYCLLHTTCYTEY